MRKGLIIPLLLILSILTYSPIAIADDQDYVSGFTDAVTLVMQTIVTNSAGDSSATRKEAQTILTQAVADNMLDTKETCELTFYVSFAVEVPVQLGYLDDSIQADNLSTIEELHDAVSIYQSQINKSFQSGGLSLTDKYALIIALDNIFDLYDDIVTDSSINLTSTSTSTSTPAPTSTHTPAPTEQIGDNPITIKLELGSITVTSTDPSVLVIPNDEVEAELYSLFNKTLSDNRLSLEEYSDWLDVLLGSIGGEVTDAKLDLETFERGTDLQAELDIITKALGDAYVSGGTITQESLDEISASIEQIRLIRLELFGVPAPEAP